MYEPNAEKYRAAATVLMKRGEARICEIAEALDLSSQRVAYWAKIAGVDPLAARRQRVTALIKRLVK